MMNEADCRYLSVTNGCNGHFLQLLKKIGVEIPSELSLAEMVRFGWITPVLRVEIPARFIQSWENFPTFSRRGAVHPDDRWADHAWVSAAISLPRGDDDSEDWYQHPLDSENPITEEIRGHAIAAGPGHPEPELVAHPRVDRLQVMPWIDYFAYWQSYELAETLKAVRLFTPVLNTPTAERALENALSSFDQLKEFSDRRIATVHRRYQERRRVFDWVSRFRTLVGRASEKHTSGDLRLAAQNLSSQLDLTLAQVKEDIREVLLVMWREWDFANSTIPQEMRRCFQKDIERAVRFHDLISEDRIDPFDIWWDPPDPNPRRWERLKEVLPLEWNKARLSLARFSRYYLKRFAAISAAEMMFDTDKVKKLTDKWWWHSFDFQRFCLSFHRLHEHYGGSVNDDNDVGVVAETPQEFLILCALHLEKFLSRQKQVTQPGSHAASVKPLLLFVLERALKGYFGLAAADVEESKKRTGQRFKAETRLHDLPSTKTNPFNGFDDIEDKLQFFETAVVNYAILRNYVAHHSCLDYEIISSDWALDPIEAMLLVLLTALEVFDPVESE